MKAFIIEHESDCVAGSVGEQLVERGYDLVSMVVTPDRHDSNPVVEFGDPADYDLIVPMGSIRSVYDTEGIGNWIGNELDFLSRAHDLGVPQLGVCFGGQALAAALGGTVERAPRDEIGWFHVNSANEVLDGVWMEWHYDRFKPPADATELASTEVCTQAFRSGRTLGLQFHPEVNTTIVGHWLDECPQEELDRFNVDPDAILAATETNAAAARLRCHRLVDWFLDHVATDAGGSHQ